MVQLSNRPFDSILQTPTPPAPLLPKPLTYAYPLLKAAATTGVCGTTSMVHEVPGARTQVAGRTGTVTLPSEAIGSIKMAAPVPIYKLPPYALTLRGTARGVLPPSGVVLFSDCWVQPEKRPVNGTHGAGGEVIAVDVHNIGRRGGDRDAFHGVDRTDRIVVAIS